jgi:hypothetical protein
MVKINVASRAILMAAIYWLRSGPYARKRKQIDLICEEPQTELCLTYLNQRKI